MRPRQTVLQVASYGGSYPGNFIPSLRAVGRELGRHGFSQTLVFSHHAKGQSWLGDVLDSGEDVRVLPASRAGALRALGATLAELRPALVHSHFSEFDGPTWLLQQLARAAGGAGAPALVWHVHSPYSLDSHPFRHRVREFLKWRILGRTTYAVVVSEGGYQAMVTSGMRADRATCIPNGIDFGRLAVRVGERGRVRRALGVEDAEALCLAFGWDPERKGVDLLFEGLREIGAAGKAKLVVVGKEKLEDFAKRSFPSGLPPWMRLAPEVDDVSGYYAASDVFLSASRLEGFPYGLAEAIATGLPVVRSDIWGTAYAADLPATVTFRLEDPDDLAHAVQEVLNWSPQERATRARAAADIVRARFGVESWARSVVAWYERILAGSQVKGWPAAAH